MAYNKKAHLRDNIEAIRADVPAGEGEACRHPGRTGGACRLLRLRGHQGGAVAIWQAHRHPALDAERPRTVPPRIGTARRCSREGATDEREYKRLVDSVKASTFTAFYTPHGNHSVRVASSLEVSTACRRHRFLDPSLGHGATSCPPSSRIFFNGHPPRPRSGGLREGLADGAHPPAAPARHGCPRAGLPRSFPRRTTDGSDVAASNIPFGDIRVFDPSMDDGTARRFALGSLHNYFFVKGLDAVREGGIVAFITSQGVMNSAMGTPVRQYLMQRARLLSAIRLPNNPPLPTMPGRRWAAT